MPMPGSRRSPPRRSVSGALSATALAALVVGGAAPLVPYQVEGDRIVAPLTGHPGDPARGQALVLDQHGSTCILCHQGAVPGMGGTVGPSLAGVAARLDPAQLRLRLVNAAAVTPDTIMPAFYALDGLTRVGSTFAGRPVLDAGQIEDIVAFLTTLRDP